MDDLPVRGEWAVGSTAAVAIKCLLWCSAFGAVLLIVLMARGRRTRHHRS